MRATVPILLLSAALTNAGPLDIVREKVLASTERVPRYTCVQTVERRQYQTSYRAGTGRCEFPRSPGQLLWRDRLRLDVAVLDGKETFAWAGASQFETTNIEELAPSGSSGSGDFASFLLAIFGLPETRISPADLTGVFRFEVPEDQSRYSYRSNGDGERRRIGYHGSFTIDTQREELRQIIVDADQFPAVEQMCRVQDVLDYHNVKIADRDFLLPETATMTVLFNNGEESRNETTYSGCREYVGETTISFGDDALSEAITPRTVRAPQPLPAGMRLTIAMTSRIDSRTAAAGDAIAGVVVGGQRGGDIVHGRILRLEQDVSPARRWVVAIRFDSIEHPPARGERTADQRPMNLRPMHLQPLDDGIRGRRNAILRIKRPPGAGVFVLNGGENLVLDGKFRSEWETR